MQKIDNLILLHFEENIQKLLLLFFVACEKKNWLGANKKQPPH
jgi:hypothetical protein